MPKLAVTTVIQQQGPSKAPIIARSQQTNSPMREEIYTADKLGTPAQIGAALQKLSRHMEEVTVASRSFPLPGGTYWPNVPFTANTEVTLAHGCTPNQQVAWAPFATRPAGATANAVTNGRIVEISQQPSTGRITLSSNETCTADLYFWTRPVSP